MGQILGNLTNPGVMSPSGQTQYYPNQGAAGIALAKQAAQTAQPSTSSISGGLDGPQSVSYQNQQGAQPQMVRPSFIQAAMTGPGGTPNAESPALTKAGSLITILRSGLLGGLAGRAASEQTVAATGGRRSGGIGAGFTAGYTQPFQEAEQRQQAQIGQAGLQPIPLPGGVTVPAAIAPKFLSPYLGYQGKIGAAQIVTGGKEAAAQTAANAKIQSTQMENQNKLDVVGLQTAITANKGSKYLSDVDPQTGQPFYHVLNPYGKEIGRADVNMLPSLMQRTSSTVDWKQDENGDWVALPKQTISGPTLPGRAGAPQAATPGTPSTPGTPNRIHGKIPELVQGTTPNGQQIAGTPAELRAAGVNEFTKMPANNQSQVITARNLTSKGGLFDMVANDLSKFKPEELDGLGNRWQEFLTGTFGADNRYIALRTHLNGLTGTALMQAHVGSRGGEHMMDHFADLADAHTFNYKNLNAAVDAERQYVEERAMRPPKASGSGGAVDSLLKKYGG